MILHLGGLALYPMTLFKASKRACEVRFGQQQLKLGVLAIEFMQPLGAGRVRAAVLGPPLVEGRVAEAAPRGPRPDQFGS